MNLKQRLLLLLTLSFSVFAESGNLLLSPGDRPLNGWQTRKNVTLSAENGRLRIAVDGPGRTGFRLRIPRNCKALLLSMKMRATGLTPGKEGWRNGRMAMRFHNRNGEAVGEWPAVFGASGTQKEFVNCLRAYPVPEGAAELRLDPGNFGTGGKIEFSDLVLRALSEQEYRDFLVSQIPFDTNLLTPQALGKRAIPPGMRVEWRNGKGSFYMDRGSCILSIPIPLPPELSALPADHPGAEVRVRYSIRTDRVVRGKLSWQNARLDMMFRDRSGKLFGRYLEIPTFLGTHERQEIDRTYAIPRGAPVLQVVPANYGASGTVAIEDVDVRLIREIRNLPPPDGSAPEALFRLDDAARVTTPFREKVSLNGLWRFRPAFLAAERENPPNDGWGWFKVPAAWPDRTNRACDHLFYLPAREMRGVREQDLRCGWYEREFTVPAEWKGRKIKLDFDLIQGVALFFVDGVRAGELTFPGGELEITSLLKPGTKQKLRIRLSADPAEFSHFMGMSREYKARLELPNKGLVGDAWLLSVPARHEISDVRIETRPVSDGSILFDTGFNKLPAGRYTLEAVIRENGKIVKTFRSAPFQTDGKAEFRHTFRSIWRDAKLWDIDTPDHLYTLDMTLRDASGNALDRLYPEEFGVREFAIEGRNLVLNGKTIHLRSLPINHTGSAADATREKYAHLARTAKSIGINYLFDGDRCYNFRIGGNSYNDQFRTVLSKYGILTSLAMPHAITDFGGNLDDPATAAAYRKLCLYRIRRVQNVPGLVLYAVNHNALGYADMQNPLTMGTDWRPEDAGLGTERRAAGLKAEAIIRSIDPTRPVYHHDAGNLGRISAQNFYLNWVPAQERSDWLEHWEKKGTMPILFVEYGIPHVASWSSNRGPAFIWRSPEVQGSWLDEFNAEYLGEEAYTLNEAKMRMFRREYAAAKNNTPTRFLTAGDVLRDPSTHKVRSMMLTRNLRDLRARGLSGFQPWDHSSFHDIVKAVNVSLHPDRFKNLKAPGPVADRIRPSSYLLSDPFSTFRVNPTGKALEYGYREQLGWIAGKAGDFTEQSSHFRPGETVEKSLLILNDTRHDQTVEYRWKTGKTGKWIASSVRIRPGERAEIPIQFRIPDKAPAGRGQIDAEFRFAEGDVLRDSFSFSILPPPAVRLRGRIGVWDPEKTAAPLMKTLGIRTKEIRKESDLDGIDMLVIGRGGMDSIPFPLSDRLKKGLRLFVLEQKLEQLNRLGIRGAEHGLRTLFPVGNTASAVLSDWRGSSTLRPYFMPGAEINRQYPKSSWNGFMNTHIWYSGQRGNVAEFLPEKPSRGNWLPIYHGGFDLQYAPALLFREGKVKILFCQLNVSGRTRNEPQAENTLAELLALLENCATPETRPVFYRGQDARKLLEQLRIPASPASEPLPGNALLVVSSGEALPENLLQTLNGGGKVLALGWNAAEIRRLVPDLAVEEGNFYTDRVPQLAETPEFEGLCDADLHLRYEETFAAFPADSAGGRLLRSVRIGKGTVVFYQMPPYRINGKEYIKRTTIRRGLYTASRLLANLGAEAETGLADQFRAAAAQTSMSLALSGSWEGMEDLKGTLRKGNNLPDFRNVRNWRKVNVPGMFNQDIPELKGKNGYFWYRKSFDLAPALAAEPLELEIGAVDDESWIWMDGKFLGEITKKTNPKDYWNVSRKYRFAPGELKPGRHEIVILCNDIFNVGGIAGSPRLFSIRDVFRMHADQAIPEDDPYRYYHW